MRSNFDLQSIDIPRNLARQKKRRLITIVCAFVAVVLLATLAFYTLQRTASFFRVPSEISNQDIASNQALRLGGYVEKGSVQRTNDIDIYFAVTDFDKSQPVVFRGVVPDLFAEGQGVIVEGHFNQDKIFVASRVLAKHDENYMPKDVADRLKQKELWEGANKRVR